MKQRHASRIATRKEPRRSISARALRLALGVSGAMLASLTPLAAQQPQSPPPTVRPSAPPQPVDTVPMVFRRAQRMVNDGNGAAGRALIDSVLSASQPRSATEAEALYWRATLAESWESAQRDYLRIMLEHERSPLAAAAMYRLAQGESARGDRDAAVSYLERLEREAPTSPMRANGGLLHSRLLVEGGRGTDACGVLRSNRPFVRSGSIELENQYDYLLRACPAEGVAAIAAEPTRMAPPPNRPANAATETPPRTTPAPTTAAPTTSAPAPTSASTQSGRWSVQAAAFSTDTEAREFAQTLIDRGYPARVDGTTAPFRVRFGHYPTREAATDASNAYKQKERADAFIVQVPRG